MKTFLSHFILRFKEALRTGGYIFVIVGSCQNGKTVGKCILLLSHSDWKIKNMYRATIPIGGGGDRAQERGRRRGKWRSTKDIQQAALKILFLFHPSTKCYQSLGGGDTCFY